jgi:AcrR family transcriptional regulator
VHQSTSGSAPSAGSKGEQRRAAILDGMRRLLDEQPYGSVSVGAIAKEAGITRPGFYVYFASKAHALFGLLVELEDEFVAVASDWYDGRTGNQIAALFSGMAETVALWRANAPLMIAIIDATAIEPLSRNHWDGFKGHFIERTTRRLELDVGSRSAALGVDLPQLSSMLVHATFAALEVDLRAATGHEPRANTGRMLGHMWCAAIYGTEDWTKLTSSETWLLP